MSPAKSPIISGFFATQTVIFLCTKTQMKNRRFPFVNRLKLPKSKYPIHRQIESKNLSAFFYCHQKGENRYATERISQTDQGSVRHQDGRQRMVGDVLGWYPPLPDKFAKKQ